MTTVPLTSGEPPPDAPEPSASPNARFLTGAVPHGADELVRFGNSILGSACTHIGGFLLALFVMGNMSVTPPSTDRVDDKSSDIVWLSHLVRAAVLAAVATPSLNHRGRSSSRDETELPFP